MLPQLHAERQLLAIEAASVPHMKPAASQALIQRYGRKAAGREKRARSLHEALGGVARHVRDPGKGPR